MTNGLSHPSLLLVLAALLLGVLAMGCRNAPLPDAGDGMADPVPTEPAETVYDSLNNPNAVTSIHPVVR